MLPSLAPRALPLLLLLPACGGGVSTGKGGQGEGESCVEADCAHPLVCAQDGTCQQEGATGTIAEGDECTATAECAYGLVCAGDNTCVQPGGPGTGDDGSACEQDEDCLAGHYCDDGGACADIGIPWWDGVACPADLEGDFYPLFDVPNLPASGQIDFYALPFPNDARLDTSGHPDLSGFPTAGDAAPAMDTILAGIEAGTTGWGLNPTVYFRFSRPQDISSITALTDDATVWMASLDEDADDYGVLTSLQFFSRHGRGRYICQNWLAVSVYDGEPLEPNHTYAVWLTKGIRSEDGATAVRDNGFKLMVGDERPEDLSLARSYDAYEPFRDFVEREGVLLEDIAGAAVFTTGSPSSKVRYFREVTAGDEVAVTADELVVCDDGVASPCDDGGARACGAAQDGFAEVHGLLSVPKYRTDGGEVAFEGSLRPTVQGTEEVCFAMTVPEGPAPEAGWPVVLHAPDVGGTFRDAVDGGLAAELAAHGIATISLELPGHGGRGGAYVDPQNPAAWLGNRLQAVADPYAAERFLAEWSAVATTSPTGEPIRFDTGSLWFMGVGEGAAVGASYLAWSTESRGGVLGNPYGYVLHAFADQSEPVDVEHGLQAALADSSLDRWHPALNLLQLWFEGGDPVNDMRAVLRDSSTGAKHLMIVEGVEDDVLPEDAIVSALRASGLPVLGAVVEDHDLTTGNLPATENVSSDDGRRTGGIVQTSGGHTALHDEAARAAAFVASGAGGAAPTIE